ncbi:MAG TPA: hypothetical protein VFP26_02050 [Gemmatimonadaceae bacterium]|nr:hypothetical protein [Gemmatimonadaceae bacterium]
MTSAQPQRNTARSVGAIVAGVVVGLVLTLGTDALLHAVGVFPPYGQIASNGALAVATAYRFVFSVLGSYIGARLAPNRPMWHAMFLGYLNLLVSAIGAIVTWNREAEFGPHWYPVSLVILALPAAWIGGRIYTSRHHDWSATGEFFAR